MTGTRLTLLCSLSLLLASPVWADASREQRLESGEILIETHPVPGTDMPEINVTAIIDAPPPRIWDILDHCGNYSRTMMKIKESRELSRQGNIVRCELTIATPWPLPNLHSITVAEHTVEAQRWRRAWKLESGDYRYNEGSWTLTPWPTGRTLVEYRLHSQPNFNVPTSFQQMAMKESLPKLIEKLRSESR